MAKPISISFGKSKPPTSALSLSGPPSRKPVSLHARLSTRPPHLGHNSDDEDEAAPRHEAITAFAANGAVLSEQLPQKEDLVIKNSGNSDWRTRGRSKNLLPAGVQAQQQAEANGDVVMIERDEVSKASGLQLAGPEADGEREGRAMEIAAPVGMHPTEPLKQTEDERALQALLKETSGERTTNAVIAIKENGGPKFYDETEDFRADVASRPESSTLEEYAAMPVEDFGLAMLRGMGQKRRANGEVISYGSDTSNEKTAKAREPRQGYLGIGAKAVPGAEMELGAWGKAAMRKNKKGEGFYTPVLLRDKRTGEMLTEDELEARKKEAREKPSRQGEEDWRERRDRNLERSKKDRDDRNGRGEQKLLTDKDDYRDQMNGFSRHSSSARDGYNSERSRKDRSRSRSKERERRKHDDDERYRERRKDTLHKDDERYDSSSSRRSGHRERDRDHERERERDRNKDRDRERDRNRYDSDDSRRRR